MWKSIVPLNNDNNVQHSSCFLRFGSRNTCVKTLVGMSKNEILTGHSKGLGDAVVIAAVDTHKYQDLSDDGFDDLDEEVSH